MTDQNKSHPHDDDDLMWEEEQRASEARRRRWKFVGVVLALWVVVFWILGYYGVQKWRSRQARQLALSAAEIASQGLWREAELRAITALQMRPDEPQVLRAAARVFDFMGNPQALGLYEKLVARPEASPEERKRYVEAAIRFGEIGVARREAAALEQAGDPGFVRLVKARELLARGDAVGAEAELRGVQPESGARAQADLQLAGLLAARGTDEARAEALKIFRASAAQTDNTGLEALASALAAGVVPHDESADWAQRLLDHPLGNDRTFLISQTARLQSDPASREAVVKVVMARFAGTPVERKAAAALWLNERNEFSRSLELLPQSEAVTNRGAFVLRLDALSGTGNWNAVDEALNDRAMPLEGALADLFRARAARMNGRSGTAAQEYKKAAERALLDPRETATAAAFLEQDGQTDVWLDTMRAGLHNPSTASAAREGLLATAKNLRDAAKLSRACKILAAEMPQDEGAQNLALYYRLVLREPGLLETARQRSAERPDDFSRKAILAFALLQDGREVEAVRTFDGLEVRSDNITPQEKAVVVSVLAANNRMDQAEAMAMTLDRATLTVQENEMVNGYMRSGAAAQTPRQ